MFAVAAIALGLVGLPFSSRDPNERVDALTDAATGNASPDQVT